jgi:hypothetical protein
MSTGDRFSVKESARLLRAIYRTRNKPYLTPQQFDRPHWLVDRFLRPKFVVADIDTEGKARKSNPYSESQFRTMKYRPEFPDRLGCIQDSRAFAQGFFRWYNEEHYHSGLALLTPARVHYQQTGPILQPRQPVLDVADQLHPERFVRQAPKQAAVPTEVWINQPCPASAGNGESVPSLK